MRIKFVYPFFLIHFLVLTSCGDSQHSDVQDVDETIRRSINIVIEEDISWEEKKRCIVYYQEGAHKTKLLATVKFRGGISSKYAKHSMSLELDRHFALGGLEMDDDWILNANYIDKTFQRHKLSYDLYREMRSKNVASQCSYLELSINGEYQGLYVLMEEINGSMLDLDKMDSNAMLFKDPLIFFEERLSNAQDPNNYYQQKSPKLAQVDNTQVMEDLKQFLFHSSDEEFAESIGTWFDVENVIDWHLILLLTNNDDGLFKNFYLYKMNQETPFRFAIWDYDHSFGRDGDYSMNMMERELGWEKITLLRRLTESQNLGYSQRLKQRYKELRSGGIFTEDHIEDLIEKNNKEIQPYLVDNQKRWPNHSKWYSDDNSYDQEIDLMKKFVALRLEYLDGIF